MTLSANSICHVTLTLYDDNIIETAIVHVFYTNYNFICKIHLTIRVLVLYDDDVKNRFTHDVLL